MPALTRQKITFGEMRAAGVRGLLVYCSDYKRGVVREFDTSRKDTQWGRRKLKRDQ
jgi:hypothetical protein